MPTENDRQETLNNQRDMQVKTQIKWPEAITAISGLIKAIAWPLVVIFVLLKFSTPVTGLIQNYAKGLDAAFSKGGKAKMAVGEVSFEVEVQKNVEAGMNLLLAKQSRTIFTNISGKSRARPIKKTITEDVHTIAKVVTDAYVANKSNPTGPISILWVDDNPTNNTYVKGTFERLGMNVDEELSTEGALARLRTKKYDLIVSDMRRGNNSQAGFDLISEVKNRWSIPVIIYSASYTEAFEKEAKRRGAFGETKNPEVLLKLVREAAGQ